MRLCEHDGAFDFSAYAALNRNVSWEEAQRILTSLIIIGDERADFGEWRQRNKPSGKSVPIPLGKQTDGDVPVLSLLDYKRELENEREGLAASTKTLQAHRAAVARGVDEGRLEPGDVDFFERLVEIHKQRLERLQAKVDELVAEGVSDGQVEQHHGRGVKGGGDV